VSFAEPGLSLSVVADAIAAGAGAEPDVPTAPGAFLSLNFRSDRIKLSAESPAFKQPVTVTPPFAVSLES